MKCTFLEVDQIEKIFTAAQKQRNWDHFTKAQRKNIELWLKQAKVCRKFILLDVSVLQKNMFLMYNFCCIQIGYNET